MRRALRGRGRDDSARGVQGRARFKAGGGRARAERTRNGSYAVLTLDLSKLSAWLNADDHCRVDRRACNAGRGIRLGGVRGRGATAAQTACTGMA